MTLLTLKNAEAAVKLMIGVVALGGTGGLSLGFAKDAIGLIKDAGSLDEAIRKLDMTDTAARLASQTKAVADAWAQSPEHRGLADAAIADFREAMPYCVPDAGAFVGQSLDADAIRALMLSRLRAADCPLRSSFAAGATSTHFFEQVTTPILAELVASPEFVAKLSPELWRDLHDRLAAIKDDTGALRSGQADQTAMLQELMRRTARPSAVTEVALIELARRVAQDVTDVDTAVRELGRMVEVAERVQAEGRTGSNLGDFVDDVLRRMAEHSARGDYKAASAEIEAALAREEAESRDRQIRLLDASVEQSVLRRDAVGAARSLARKAELEAAHVGLLFGALRNVWSEWYERGRDKGLNFDLEVAIALANITRKRSIDASQRCLALNDLGTALTTLGEREVSTSRLEQAVAAHRLALEERTREPAPLDWAMSQVNLANALHSLGQRETGTVRIEEAVAAYRLALEEITRILRPLDWATTQGNLAAALLTLGQRDSGTAQLEDAVAAFRLALEENTRERVPLMWATTQGNLGAALLALGQRAAGTKRLEEAVIAHGLALEVWTRRSFRLDWARTQINLGNTLRALGSREAENDRIEEAVVAYRLALEEMPREQMPLDWAMAHVNLGMALRTLGTSEDGTARIEGAVAAYRFALEEITRERAPLDWARTQTNLGNALQSLARRETGTARLTEAIAAYRLALEVMREEVPFEWARIHGNFCSVEIAFFDKTGNFAHLDAADRHLAAAREVFAEARATQYLAMADQQAAEVAARRGG